MATFVRIPDPDTDPKLLIPPLHLGKRLLRARQQIRQNGRRSIVYEQPGSGDVLVIQDPALRLDQLEAVQHDVARLLEHGLPSEGQPVEEPFVPTAPGLPLEAAANAEPVADSVPAVNAP